MENKTNYPVSFYFKLSFEGIDAGFQEASGISKELIYEEVASGGENKFTYKLPTISKTENLVLKRALIPTGSKLIDWCSKTIDTGLTNGIKTQDVLLTLLNVNGEDLVSWTFYNAYPVKYAVSDFKSYENKLAIETIELAYTYFKVRQ